MTSKDDAILEYLCEVGSAEPQRVIHWNMTDEALIDCHYRTIGRRLEKLVGAGLVDTPRGTGSTDQTYYRISEKGREYLGGEFKPD